MLYYYFGSKEGLFREILRRRMHERSASLRTAGVAGTNRLAERAERIIGDAEYTRLLMWEALETKPDQPVNEEIRREFFQTWVAAVDAGQAAVAPPGRPPRPAQLVLSEICLTLGPMVLPDPAGHRLTPYDRDRRHRDFLESYERRIEEGSPARAD